MFILRSLLLTSVLLPLVLFVGCADEIGPANNETAETSESAEQFENLKTPPAAESSDPASGPNTDAFLGGGAAKTTPPTQGEEPKTESPEVAAPVEKRTTLAGRWELAVHLVGRNLLGILVEITPTDNGFEVKAVGDSPLGWTLKDSEIKDNAVHLSVAAPGDRTIDFRGIFTDGVVRGTIDAGTTALDLATLRPTARDALTQENMQEPTNDAEKLSSLKPDENLLPNLMKIAEDSGVSPLGYQLLGRAMAMIQMEQSQDVDVPRLIDVALKAAAPWGAGAVSRTHVDIAFTLALRNEMPEEALKHLEEAKKGFGENLSEQMQERIELTRGLILAESEETRDQGIELLQAAHDKNPYNLLATTKLAEVFEKQGRDEEALAMYLELAALPSIPSDRAKIEALWKKVGRDPQKLDQHLNEIYEEITYHFAKEDEPVAPAVENQQVVLGELFTGATCPPCVAADVATGALEQVIPDSRLLMLRYHQHIPGPDPMTISEGEVRRDYYQIQGTPSVYFNGQQIQGIGGSFMNAQAVYSSLKQLIAPMLEQSSDLTIDLTANADESGENIHVHAEVNGADAFPDHVRLRLALAEESLHYPAPNGIRIHEMVVRAMPGGANGIASDNGVLSFDADVPVKDVLAAIQEGVTVANERSGGQLPKLTPRIDSLRLVAFVQDDETLQVLQAASTPVNGLAPTTASAPAESTESSEPAEPAEPAESTNETPAAPAEN